MWITAMSSAGSTPSTSAAKVPLRPWMVTLTLTEPSTTWLFVSTSPDDVMISPVPAALPVPLAVWMTVLTSTTAGETLRVMALMSRLALLAGFCWTGCTEALWGWVTVVRLLMKWARFQPMPIPPPVARMTAATMAAVRRRGNPGAAGGGAAAAGAGYAVWESGAGGASWGSGSISVMLPRCAFRLGKR